MGAIPGGFGQAGYDRIPRVIIGGGIGDECGHGQVSAIGQSDNADVVGRRGDAVASAAGAGLVLLGSEPSIYTNYSDSAGEHRLV